MKRVDMLKGPVWKCVAGFSVPLFFTYLIQLLYHTTDTLFVGRFLGTEAQAVVVYPVTWFTAAFLLAVLYSILKRKMIKGEKNYETQNA